MRISHQDRIDAARFRQCGGSLEIGDDRQVGAARTAEVAINDANDIALRFCGAEHRNLGEPTRAIERDAAPTAVTARGHSARGAQCSRTQQQRDPAQFRPQLNIALGLANAYLKHPAKKGFIKIHEAPLNRYAYYLTPYGFAEKSWLTTKYLSFSFDFFRQARQDCIALLPAFSAFALWLRPFAIPRPLIFGVHNMNDMPS